MFLNDIANIIQLRVLALTYFYVREEDEKIIEDKRCYSNKVIQNCEGKFIEEVYSEIFKEVIQKYIIKR